MEPPIKTRRKKRRRSNQRNGSVESLAMRITIVQITMRTICIFVMGKSRTKRSENRDPEKRM